MRDRALKGLSLFCLVWGVTAIAIGEAHTAAGAAPSPSLVTVVRADGQAVPVVSGPVAFEQCKGVAVVSHGAGGTEKDLAYVTEPLQAQGWWVIHPGHKESGPDILRSRTREAGFRAGTQELITDASAYTARFADIAAALAWATPQCHSNKKVLIGHSMGAATAMLEAGAADTLGVSGQDRFDAYVVLSPQGPGVIFSEQAWGGIAKPVLVMTGTRDFALGGGWLSRTIPFERMAPGCKWLGVVEGATHFNFAGVGFAGKTQQAVLALLKPFLDGVTTGRCGAPPFGEQGVTVRQK